MTGLFRSWEAGGELWVVIQKKQGAPSTIDHLERTFRQCRDGGEEKRVLYTESKKILTDEY